ncbi:S8 family serine peptidase [Paeniglutamicibacter sp. R2-26]|uniref:S8 family serine peptidase n=1 Tax=Paeniglutamicibacter sp. R2-26 TaxID=3144417 RepID=UPI003EE55B48
MTNPRRPKIARTILASATGLALAVTMSVPSMAALPTADPSPGGDAASLGGLTTENLKSLKVAGSLKKAQGEVSVFVQFEGEGAFEATQPAAAAESSSALVKDPAKVKKIRSDIKAKGKTVAKVADAEVIYTTSNSIPGVALRGDAEDLRALAARSDVKKITAIVPKTPDNKNADIDTKALETWSALKQTGKGVTIAVLDTGIDYTHAGFGGPGTLEGYEAAQSSSTIPAKDSGLYDPKKFIGGWDLVGDDYNADPRSPGYQPVPKPDANPLDCSSAGHGSHVAGSAAGYGVNADGSTFKGDFTGLTADDVSGMRIGPGSAPEAALVGIRVFGCEGSSDVVGQALDYVLDPNNDGNFDDRAQIINMSLGSDQSPADDPETDIVNSLAKLGILSVVSSGNSGDITDVGGAPGNARSALTVANSVGSKVTLDGITVEAPSDAAGTAAGQYSSNFNYAAADPAKLSGQVVMGPAGNPFGCSPFAPGSLEGKWVWLKWSENQVFPCGSAVRFNNAQAAGATGVILDSEVSVFEAGIGGNTTLPGAQFTKAYSDSLRPAAEAGTLKVTLDPALVGTAAAESGKGDTLNSGSSRGVHGSEGIVKPDVAAPGTLIGSVGVGTGNGPAVMSGTSMAAPHAAGIAALVAGSGKYSAYEIKSIVMNTASADVLAANGKAYGPNRVGSGRVIASAAVETPAYAFATDAPDLTSVVFGVIELDKKKYKSTKSITVVNKSSKTQTYNVKYVPATEIPGASYSLSERKVTLKAGKSTKIKVTLNIDSRKFAKTLDPTMDRTQLGVPRAWVSDVSGRVELTSSSAPTLRVPVHAAPKLVSDMEVDDEIEFKKGATTAKVELEGKHVLAGTGDSRVLSLVAGFEFGAASPRQGQDLDSTPGGREMDLQYVGAASTAPTSGAADGLVNFGVSTWGNWAHLAGGTEIDIEIDTNNDGRADFLAYNTTADGLDLDVVATYDLSTGKMVDQQFLNGLPGSVDSNTFDTNVATFPVSLAALGLSGSSAPIKYRVLTYSQYNTDETGANVPVDGTKWIGFDAIAPALSFDGDGTVFADLDDTKLTARLKAGTKEAQALFLHLHNATGDLSGKNKHATGDRAELVKVEISNKK